MDQIEKAFKKALNHYPELHDEKIELKYYNINSVMQSRPNIFSLFFKKRIYYIIINKNSKNTGLSYKNLNQETLTGWFGHELAHIVDYKKMNNFQLTIFGLKYLFSNTFKRNIERKTDKLTIKKGLGKQLIKSIKAITRNPKINLDYRQKISKFYLKVKEAKKLIKLYKIKNLKKPKFFKKNKNKKSASA